MHAVRRHDEWQMPDGRYVVPKDSNKAVFAAIDHLVRGVTPGFRHQVEGSWRKGKRDLTVFYGHEFLHVVYVPVASKAFYAGRLVIELS